MIDRAPDPRSAEVAAAAPALSVRGVSKSFGSARVFSDLSLEVAHGEFVSLLGPSGCGKTTLLRMVSGFVMPDAGSIAIDGRPVTDVPPRRRNLGMVFQNYSLWPHMTVAQNVAFGLETRRMPAAERRDRVAATLELVGLGGMDARLPKELSGGQRQRVAIARAIVYEPSILLLDEPLSALDRKLRERMQVDLREMQSRLGITTILVTHDQEEALLMSDRIAVMEAGRIHQLATPQAIYDSPTTGFVADFVGRMNLFDVEVSAVDGAGATLRGPEGQVWRTTALRPGLAAGQRLRVMLRPERIRIAHETTGGGQAATVRGATFNGPLIYADCVLQDGTHLTVAVPHAWGGAVSPGETVWLDWQEDALRILEEDPPHQQEPDR